VLQAFLKLPSVAHLPLLDKGPLLFLILASATVAMATLSWKFLEQLLNGLKRHFPYQPEGLLGGAGSSFVVFTGKERSSSRFLRLCS
jgi:peptidoglycan/LPS O-acetylase OafA/YrhL